MKKISFAALSATLILAAASCQHGNDPAANRGEKLDLKIAGTTILADGDSLGLFFAKPAAKVNEACVVKGGVAETYWSKDMTEEQVGILAYFPYLAENDKTTRGTFTACLNQSSDASLKKSDFLAAVAKAGVKSGSVNLEFAHKGSKIVVYVKGDNVESVTLDGAYNTATFDQTTGDTRISGKKSAFTAHNSAKDAHGAYAYEFIIPAQSFSPVITVKAGSATVSLTVTENVSFKAGTQYSVKKLVVPSESSVVSAEYKADAKWVEDKDFAFDYAVPGGPEEFTKTTAYGFYELDGTIATPAFLYEGGKNSMAVRNGSKIWQYRIQNFDEGTLAAVTTETNIFEKDAVIPARYKLVKDGISLDGVTEIKVVKVEKNTLWLECNVEFPFGLIAPLK